MPKRVHKVFPDGDACPNCGRQLSIYRPNRFYKYAYCDKEKGCGWFGYEEKGQHREKTSDLVP